MAKTPVVLVHGGAWAIPDELVTLHEEGVKEAARAGTQALLSGSAVDAVEAAVCVLEDNPVFDAGRGSVLNEDGEVEMDAIIMEGTQLRAGAVASVKNIAHPITLARTVLEKTDHVMLVGNGANRWARECGIPEVERSYLVTEAAHNTWEELKKYSTAVKTHFREGAGHETVGAVAVDRNGHVACATSTGGITFKMVGRVGDSPVIGCGAYCDDHFGSVSCTGHGEAIMQVCLAKHIINLLDNGLSAQEATTDALRYMKQRVGGTGGAITITTAGDVGLDFTTQRMAWAYTQTNQLHWGLNLGEHYVEPYRSIAFTS